MKTLARFLMILSWLVLSAHILLIVAAALAGEAGPMLDMVDLPEDTPHPPGWALVFGSGLVGLTITLLGVGYWQFHRVLQMSSRIEFSALARHLGYAGRALLGFWLCFATIERVLPFALTWNMAPGTRPEIDWLPVDLDLILVVLAVTLWSMAGVMARAAVIDDENRHFL